VVLPEHTDTKRRRYSEADIAVFMGGQNAAGFGVLYDSVGIFLLNDIENFRLAPESMPA